MLRYILIFLSVFCIEKSFATSQTVFESAQLGPKLWLSKGEEALIQQSITSDPTLKKVHDIILSEGDKMIALPLLERKLDGKRLLAVSREAIRRIFYLSYAWRMTAQEKYFLRAEQEMLNVAAFSDWNPSHFLDVAEMTLGLAIGYDWLTERLSEASKVAVRNAIIKKGIQPSFDSRYNGWLRVTHNWNQVCNAGISLGAMAVYDNYKDSADIVLNRAIRTLPLAMNVYNPDGVYPEGYGYWSYGTAFNVLFIDAYEKFTNTAYNLSDYSGFLKTSEYLMHMARPSSIAFNYSDNGAGLLLQEAQFWFAKRYNDWSLITTDKKLLQTRYQGYIASHRLLPLILVWMKEKTLNDVTTPYRNFYYGRGINPVAIMRTSWSDPNALFFGLKCGSPNVGHGHMDIGSFVFDADGVNWASDFGVEDYGKLEANGVDLWNMAQTSTRWNVFRYNNLTHNTLTFNNKYQNVSGYASLESTSNEPQYMNAIVEMSPAYAGQITNAKRGVALINNAYGLVRDEITSRDTPTTLRWTMLTYAAVTINNDNTVTLTSGTKKLIVKFNASMPITIKTWSAVSPQPYEAVNTGATLLGFESVLQPNSLNTINTFLVPERNIGVINQQVETLSNWPATESGTVLKMD